MVWPLLSLVHRTDRLWFARPAPAPPPPFLAVSALAGLSSPIPRRVCSPSVQETVSPSLGPRLSPDRTNRGGCSAGFVVGVVFNHPPILPYSYLISPTQFIPDHSSPSTRHAPTPPLLPETLSADHTASYSRNLDVFSQIVQTLSQFQWQLQSCRQALSWPRPQIKRRTRSLQAPPPLAQALHFPSRPRQKARSLNLSRAASALPSSKVSAQQPAVA